RRTLRGYDRARGALGRGRGGLWCLRGRRGAIAGGRRGGLLRGGGGRGLLRGILAAGGQHQGGGQGQAESRPGRHAQFHGSSLRWIRSVAGPRCASIASASGAGGVRRGQRAAWRSRSMSAVVLRRMSSMVRPRTRYRPLTTRLDVPTKWLRGRKGEDARCSVHVAL